MQAAGMFEPPPASSPVPFTSELGWTYEVPVDRYKLAVDFPDGAYQHADLDVLAWPPGFADVLRIAT